MPRPKAKHISNDIPVETAFMVKKEALHIWQIIELKIQGDKVIERIEREPDLNAIITHKLISELRKSE